MATIYPDTGFQPLLFAPGHAPKQTWTLRVDAPAEDGAPGAGDTVMNLTYVVFFYPDPSLLPAPPQGPTLEIDTHDGSGWQAIDGSGLVKPLTTATPAPNSFVNYNVISDAANGLYKIRFTHGSGAGAGSINGQSWDIRFSNTEPSVPATNSAGLTFVVDPADALLPWIATPGQTGALMAAGPAVIDFGAALSALTLGGAAAAAKRIIAGRPYPLTVPLANYGPGPLTVTAIAPAAAVNNVTLSAATPLVVPPGKTRTLQANFAAPAAGQTASPATVAAFSLACDDPLAPAGAFVGHFNTIKLNGSAGNFEIVLALDVSGSMATPDAGGDTRWNALQVAAVGILNDYKLFAAANDKIGIVLYPKDFTTSGEVLLPSQPIKSLTISNVPFAAHHPIDGTPMLGSPSNPGGVYLAAGDPSGVPQTDCGQFKNADDDVYLRNFRWLILMSDGASNVGEDAKTVFVPGGTRASYFVNRNIAVISVAYGTPGGGQVDADALSKVAAAGNGGSFIPALPSGLPSKTLGANFYKAIGEALGLTFATDPDAALDAATRENRHKVMVTEHDRAADFKVWFATAADSKRVNVELITPLGERVTSSNAAGLGIQFDASSLSRGFHVDAAALENPRNAPRYGVWTIVVNRGDVRDAGREGWPVVHYAYGVAVDSELTFVTQGRPHEAAGAAVTVTAALALRGRPIADAQVVATIAGSGQGFENWLAAQVVTQAEFDAARRKLEEQKLQDIQALFIKTQALADKGVTFPGLGANVTQALAFDSTTGTYATTFAATTLPGGYQFLISATGQDDAGNLFTRQQTHTTTVTARPDGRSTLISIAYQFDGRQMLATLTVWPRDRFGNVYLADPAISQAIAILLSGGAKVLEPLRWNLDGSFTEVFVYAPNKPPTIGVSIDGSPIVSNISPPDFGKLIFVREVVSYRKGREAKDGVNKHTDPGAALGDPSQKPLSEFVSLGGGGIAEYGFKREIVHATAITVFVALDSSLRAYAVEVLPGGGGHGWIEVGRSAGVTQTFGLTSRKRIPPDAKDWFLEIEGRVAGESFDIEIPLQDKLHRPPDPLRLLSATGVARVRVRDLSNLVVDPGGSASVSPGVSLLGIGLTP